uniref:Large ribosomal subunit protein uL24c n=1 Tax=Gastroclonium compressum TaxID=1852973 RepID=A0A173G059_GASCM|nr:50S ribosomal protein L24 [Coeloseira compressa]ANH09666.1 50S ribosomal protein L24 [Coeloseira compressa]
MIKKISSKMHIKTGDKVTIISGKYKGKTGIINKINKKKQEVFINKINMIKKHQKANNEQKTGQILTREAPLHASNVKKI